MFGTGRSAGILFITLLLLLPLAAVAQQAQQVEVKSGESPMDGESFVQLSVSAVRPYTPSFGGLFTPVLQVQCKQKASRRKLDVYLLSGGVDPSSTYVTKSFFSTAPYSTELRVKMDSGKPSARIWGVMNDNTTLAYTATNGKSKDALVKDILAAGIVYIEFRPNASTANVVAEFDVRGLQPEFIKHHECK
jgi:hypothetical protein